MSKKKRSERSEPTEDNVDECGPVEKRSKDDTDISENVKTGDKKRNKKKKKVEVDASESAASKVSKRQLKREKHAQRAAEADTASHRAVQAQALGYLSLWKHNKAEWKFNKVKQIWLHRHKFDADKIPEELWQPFVEYFSAAAGSIKRLLIDDCQKVIERMEKRSGEDPVDDDDKSTDFAYRRARDLLQNIHG